MTCGLVHASYSLPEWQAGDGKIGRTLGAIHSTKIPTGPTGKSGPPQKVDLFFRNFCGWTKPIHWVLDQNFWKFWLNGSCPLSQVPSLFFSKRFFLNFFFWAQLPTGTHYIIILFLFWLKVNLLFGKSIIDNTVSTNSSHESPTNPTKITVLLLRF